MAIPTYQDVMLPMLKLASDGQQHTLQASVEHLGQFFKLTEAEKAERLPSGSQYKFNNRVSWARGYMKQAGLLEYPSRGEFRITDRGREVLSRNPKKIDVNYLMQFPDFVDFRNRTNKDKSDDKAKKEDEKTPKEAIEEGCQKLRDELVVELLENVKSCTPKFFEQLVIDLLIAMGYGGSRKEAGKRVGQSGDGGIDGVIDEDKLGLDVIYVQAKRWQSPVGSKEIRNFVGSLVGRKANKGIFITTSSFTKDALNYIETIHHKVILIDGDQLAQHMIDHNVGVSRVAAYEIKKIDSDYFMEA